MDAESLAAVAREETAMAELLRRLVLDGRRRVPEPLPARALSGRAGGRPQGARVEATVAGAVAQRPELAAFDVEVVYEGFHLPSVTETAQVIALFIRDWCGLAG